MVLQRLKKAEDAIERIEQKQGQTDQSLNQMRDFMATRFQQVMDGLADLQAGTKRKTRAEDDQRGGCDRVKRPVKWPSWNRCAQFVLAAVAWVYDRNLHGYPTEGWRREEHQLQPECEPMMGWTSSTSRSHYEAAKFLFEDGQARSQMTISIAPLAGWTESQDYGYLKQDGDLYEDGQPAAEKLARPLSATGDLCQCMQMVGTSEMSHQRAGERPSIWAAANVTSFNKHWRELLQRPPAIWFLTETLLHHTDGVWVHRAMAAAGRQLSTGASCQKVGALGARKAGVAIMVNAAEYTLREMPRPEALQEPYVQSRAHIALLGAKASPLKMRLVVYYGRPMMYDENAQELMAILDELAVHEDQPTALAGDLNIPDTYDVWHRLHEHGRWFDTHDHLLEDGWPKPTCWPSNGPPTRLDYFVVNAVFRQHLRSSSQIQDMSLPTHIPVQIQIDYEPHSLPILLQPTPLPQIQQPAQPMVGGLDHCPT